MNDYNCVILLHSRLLTDRATSRRLGVNEYYGRWILPLSAQWILPRGQWILCGVNEYSHSVYEYSPPRQWILPFGHWILPPGTMNTPVRSLNCPRLLPVSIHFLIQIQTFWAQVQIVRTCPYTLSLCDWLVGCCKESLLLLACVHTCAQVYFCWLLGGCRVVAILTCTTDLLGTSQFANRKQELAESRRAKQD